MEIIDAHIHRFTGDHARDLARRAGHENSEEHLRSEYARLNIAGAVVMGNRSLEADDHQHPEYLRYCIGLDRSSGFEIDIKQTYEAVERNLQRKNCVGIKLYPGYNQQYLYDSIYTPVYKLAEQYNKTVAVHTGELVFTSAQLKYCHPLTLDEVAVSFPKVQFVMCHLGNPWIVDAVAVLSKNHNVAADLSGLLEGILDFPAYIREQEGYISHIKTWLTYLNAYDRLIFGTDWPLANLDNYIDFVKILIPELYHKAVFADNARRIYGLDF
jgi:predicted TIM-barrel fold metal-dependent hydrolase